MYELNLMQYCYLHFSSSSTSFVSSLPVEILLVSPGASATVLTLPVLEMERNGFGLDEKSRGCNVEQVDFEQFSC